MNFLSSSVYNEVYFFAAGAHAGVGQKRKYSGQPYIVHPKRVSEEVYLFTGDETATLAALLHDVIEDTSVTYADIVRYFGGAIADLVLEVTDVSRPEDGNRKKRKQLDLEHLKKASYHGKAIKLADIADNVVDIALYDPSFARVYVREAQNLLDQALTGSDPILFAHTQNIVNITKNSLTK